MLYDHHAISFADRTGQSCQRLLGGHAETAQSLCNLHNLQTKTGCCSCDVLADSLQESTIIWGPKRLSKILWCRKISERCPYGYHAIYLRCVCGLRSCDFSKFVIVRSSKVQNRSGYDARASTRKGGVGRRTGVVSSSEGKCNPGITYV